MLACLVTIPFTASTIVVRILALGIISVFQPIGWRLILLLVLTVINLASGMACRPVLVTSQSRRQLEELSLIECWLGRKCSSLVRSIPRMALKAVAEVLIPLGYQEDQQLGCGKVRGAALIGLNYLVVMVGFSCISPPPNFSSVFLFCCICLV